MREYKEWAMNIVNRATVNSIHSNNQYNCGSFILDVDYSMNKFFADVWGPAHVIGDVVADAYDPEMEEKKRKASEFRATKMPEIIEWVKNNTDKEGEDIIKLALHIFNKKYGE